MSGREKPIRGTAEWAVATIDCCIGCPHGCRYCYARYDQVDRRRLVSDAQWQICTINEDEVAKVRPLYLGQIMFPAHHDIVPDNLAACRTVILNLLTAGNQVLVVSKPHFSCIEELCRELGPYRDRVLFRFTITARNTAILKLWEPQAPVYSERRACLELAFREGFATSVSIEPMLDPADVVAMIDDLQPFVTHSLWLGRMNKISERVRRETPAIRAAIEKIEKEQNDEYIHELYLRLRDRPLIRWKESIKAVVGLELAREPGLDV